MGEAKRKRIAGIESVNKTYWYDKAKERVDKVFYFLYEINQIMAHCNEPERIELVSYNLVEREAEQAKEMAKTSVKSINNKKKESQDGELVTKAGTGRTK